MKLLKYALIGLALSLTAANVAYANAPGTPPPIAVPAIGTPPSISYNGTSARAALYADTSIFPAVTVINEGTVPIFCKLGDVTVLASTTVYDFEVAPNYGYRAVWAGNSTNVACISAGTSGTARVTQSNGAPTIGSLGGNGGNSGGNVADVTAASAGLAISPTTGHVLVGLTNTANIQTSSPYTVQTSDLASVVAANSGSAFAVSLSAATVTGFTTGASLELNSFGVGTATVTLGGGTFDNGQSTLRLTKQEAFLWSDSTNNQWHGLVGLPACANGSGFGNVSGSTDYPTCLTQAQATALLANFSSSLAGLAPASGGGTTNFLRADGTWVAPPGGSSVTWPANTDLVISNTTNSPAGLAPVNGDCVVGSGGAWTAGSCATAGVSSITGTANQITASASTGAITLSIPAVAQIATSLAIGGCTISTNAFCATGTSNISGAASFGSNVALTNNGAAFELRTTGTSLTSPVNATLHLGGIDGASAVAQTLGVQGVATGNLNVAGALWKFADSGGTGSAASGGYEWDTHPLGGSSTSPNAAVSEMTLSSAGVLNVAGGYSAAGTAGVSCAANTVTLLTEVVTSGLVTHC